MVLLLLQSIVYDQYLCDGADDCQDGYDEDKLLCTAARRPPVEETASFLQSLLNSHGSDFLEILFGPRAKNNMKKLGGVQNVAIVLSGQLLTSLPVIYNEGRIFRILHR